VPQVPQRALRNDGIEYVAAFALVEHHGLNAIYSGD
jgi:hypothetical protein